MGLMDELLKVAEACSHKVTNPLQAGCCGMAGDRGLIYPELVQAATKMEVKELLEEVHDGYYSSSRMCESALEKATGQAFHSILYLLEEVTSEP
jgi:D-lactate dehydrogenase